MKRAVELGKVNNSQATDSGSPPLSASVSVNITVLDVNDNAPMFDDTVNTRVSLVENAPPGQVNLNLRNVQKFFIQVVTKVSASDPDLGRNGMIVFRLLSHRDKFMIDAEGEESV